MAERAAHLVDHVLPAVPIRQWVLSLPFRLRYVLAFDHALCLDVLEHLSFEHQERALQFVYGVLGEANSGVK